MIPYLDRAAHLRGDADALARERSHPDARYAATWRGQCLLTLDDPPKAAWLPLRGASTPEPLVYLGRDRLGRPCFAADLSGLEPPPTLPGRFVDLLRAGWRMDPAELEPLFYARGILHWHRVARSCERCGAGDLVVREGGFKRSCTRCETSFFPRTDPAVMVLVTRQDRALLARQPGFPKGMYSALAGFVEPGETLEQCAYRETKEEVGLEIETPTYVGSQPWPFPQSLMIGFRAEAKEENVVLDPTELEEARWLTRAELRAPEGFFYPPPMSLAHALIRSFAFET